MGRLPLFCTSFHFKVFYIFLLLACQLINQYNKLICNKFPCIYFSLFSVRFYHKTQHLRVEIIPTKKLNKYTKACLISLGNTLGL